MISTTSSSISYAGNASTSTAYVIPFPFLEVGHIAASKTSATGTVTPLVYGTDFAVSGTPDLQGRFTGGSLTTTTAIPETETIKFKRVTPRTQTLNMVQGSRFSAEAVESALDKMTMILQEIERDYAAADVAIDARLDALEA